MDGYSNLQFKLSDISDIALLFHLFPNFSSWKAKIINVVRLIGLLVCKKGR